MKTRGVLLQLLLGRRIVAFGKKDQLAIKQGEHGPRARALGVEPVKFRMGGGARINTSDPGIAARLEEEQDSTREHQCTEDHEGTGAFRVRAG